MKTKQKLQSKTIRNLVVAFILMFITLDLSAQSASHTFPGKTLVWGDNDTYNFVTNWNVDTGNDINRMYWSIATASKKGRAAMTLNLGRANNNAIVPKTLTVGDVQGLIGTETSVQLGQHTNKNEGFVGTPSSNKFHIGTNNTPNITMLSSGYTGIGTENPQTRLHIKNTTGGDVIRLEGSGSNANFISFYKSTSSSNSRLGYVGFGSTNNDDYYIGVDDPANKLHLSVNRKSGVVVHSDIVYVGSNKYTISSDYRALYKLWVEKGVVSEDFVIAPHSAWADFVFESNYVLRPLDEVENFINKNGHLPEIPSAETIEKEGYSTAEMNIKFMMKIEELTLYTIQQEKEIKGLKAELENYKNLQAKVNKLMVKLNAQN